MSELGNPVSEHIGDPVSSASINNLANRLTVFRIFLVPLFVGAMWFYNDFLIFQWASAAIFLAAALTDVLDGQIARKYNLVTDFGKIADPIADKLLIGSAFILLSPDPIPWVVTAIVLSRELIVTALRFFVIKRAVIPASRGGKAKTLSQTIAVVLFLIPTQLTGLLLGPFVLWIAVVLTIVTGVDYVVKAIRIVRQTAPAEGAL